MTCALLTPELCYRRPGVHFRDSATYQTRNRQVSRVYYSTGPFNLSKRKTTIVPNRRYVYIYTPIRTKYFMVGEVAVDQLDDHGGRELPAPATDLHLTASAPATDTATAMTLSTCKLVFASALGEKPPPHPTCYPESDARRSQAAGCPERAELTWTKPPLLQNPALRLSVKPSSSRLCFSSLLSQEQFLHHTTSLHRVFQDLLIDPATAATPPSRSHNHLESSSRAGRPPPRRRHDALLHPRSSAKVLPLQAAKRILTLAAWV